MITFAERADPLAIAAVFAEGEAARALATKLRARLPLPGIAAVRAGDAIVAITRVAPLRDGIPTPANGSRCRPTVTSLRSLIGEALPWVEGAIWLGREPSAPALLIPTRLRLAPHPALVLAALARRGVAPPVALVPCEARSIAVPLGGARAPGEDELSAYLGAP